MHPCRTGHLNRIQGRLNLSRSRHKIGSQISHKVLNKARSHHRLAHHALQRSSQDQEPRSHLLNIYHHNFRNSAAQSY